MTPIARESGFWRRFCQSAAAAYGAVVLYTLMVKVPGGTFGGDWLHTVLHVVTGGVALVLAGSPRNARLFAGSVLVAYGSLGVLGWSTEGGDVARRRAAQLDAAQRRSRASH